MFFNHLYFFVYVGEVGSASKMNLVLQVIQGVAITALSEGLALADRAGLKGLDVMEILGLTAFANKMIKDKGDSELFPPPPL